MQLFLIRHAAAEPLEPGQTDADRPLTEDGAADFERVVHSLSELDVQVDRLIHSPLLRAVQTAELCRPLLAGRTEVTPHLAEPPGEDLLELVRERPSDERVALVGHEPHLSQLLAWLMIGWQVLDGPEHAGLFDFKKGGVAWLEGDPWPGAMTLRGFFPPKALRRLRRRR